ncbi:MAG: hypothetical protein HY888_07485 [Deltaproteobacteria bacterium]|nr:hypothetical protein [Deltaproteobacteria bacterium]
MDRIAGDSLSAEAESMQKLLAEVQRTLRDNQQFILRLKEDDADLEEKDEEEASPEACEPDEFEEL